MKVRKFSSRVLAVVTMVALLIMCVSFTATAAQAPQVGCIPTITPELINKLRESVIVYDYRTELPSASSGISPYATRSVTIPAGGTVAISTDTYGVGDTLYITVTSNSGNALLFFYLMNSGGPEPLAVFNNLAVAAKREVFRHNIIGELGDRIR